MIRVVLLLLGYGFILLGLVGIVAPILPGWIFVFVGLVILAKQAPWARRTLEWFKARHPWVRRMIDDAESIATRWTRRATVKVGRLLKPAAR